MPTTTKILAECRSQVVMTAQTPKKTLAVHGARLISWKAVLFQSLGRELHALHIQGQERAFMATAHGVNYLPPKGESAAVH